jgi:hypothetical protein
MESNTPTAEEFYNLNPETIEDIGKGRTAHTKRIMIEFAKLHVEAALKEANEKAIMTGYVDSGQTILNAYPLENIK